MFSASSGLVFPNIVKLIRRITSTRTPVTPVNSIILSYFSPPYQVVNYSKAGHAIVVSSKHGLAAGERRHVNHVNIDSAIDSLTPAIMVTSETNEICEGSGTYGDAGAASGKEAY